MFSAIFETIAGTAQPHPRGVDPPAEPRARGEAAARPQPGLALDAQTAERASERDL